jgi:hypothetical protein
MWFQLAVKRYNGTSWVTEAGGVPGAPGLIPVKPTSVTGGTIGTNGAVTIGTAVSSIAVSGAFNSTYDNYVIGISGGAASGSTTLNLRLGATTTNYYYQYLYTNWNNTFACDATTTATSWLYAGSAGADGLSMNCNVLSPNLAKVTRCTASGTGVLTTYVGNLNGMLNNTTQYSDFTVLVGSGTVTGGTIRIYGYNNN